jgi:hypothetical protein
MTIAYSTRCLNESGIRQTKKCRRTITVACVVLALAVLCPNCPSMGRTQEGPDASQSDGTLPAISDIVAMYRVNARLPKRLRVVLREKHQPLDARLRAMQRKLDVGRQLLASGQLAEQQSLQMEQELVSLEARMNQLPAEVPRWTLIDYWTDFESFQAQCQRLDDTAGPESLGEMPEVSFPGLLLGGDELLGKHSGFEVVSFGAPTDRKFRYWQALPVAPPLGRVGLENPWSSMMHPPIVMPPNQWGARLNPCDEFIRLAEQGDGFVAGAVTLESRPLLLAVVRSAHRSMRAFVDITRGAIPVRLEIFDYELSDEFEPAFPGVCIDHPKLTAQHIVEAIEIKELPVDGESFFYPVSGRSLELSRAASEDDAISTVQKQLAAYFSHEWTALRVEPGFELNDPGFSLPFPSGTVFLDDASGDSWVVGDPGEALVRLSESAVSLTRRPVSYVWWFAVGAAAVILLLVVWSKRRKVRP